MTLPSSAKTLIIGGGIIGCSTAYHLAQMGEEVLLLEKAALTSGSTWHAAGLVGQLRSNANITQLLGYSIDLYNKLEQEQPTSSTRHVGNGVVRVPQPMFGGKQLEHALLVAWPPMSVLISSAGLTSKDNTTLHTCLCCCNPHIVEN